MLIGPGALEPAPGYAVVPEHVVVAVVRELTADADMRPQLERVWRRLEAEQPAVAGFLAGELSAFEAPSAQALAYFLFLTTCAAFREGFGARLGPLSDGDLDRALETLLADGEVRSQTCPAGSFSQDVVAQWQPALMRLVEAEIDAARGQAELEPELDAILQVLLVLIVALTRAVAER